MKTEKCHHCELKETCVKCHRKICHRRGRECTIPPYHVVNGDAICLECYNTRDLVAPAKQLQLF